MPHRHFGLRYFGYKARSLVLDRQITRLQAVHSLQCQRAAVPQQTVGRSRQAVTTHKNAVPKRAVATAARSKKGSKGEDGRGSSQATPADAKQLLRALIQLASRTTIIVGSHQAHVSSPMAQAVVLQQQPTGLSQACC